MGLITVAEAQTYFDQRLHTEAWEMAAPVTKQKAISQAERMISSLPMVSPPDNILKDAVCEQALFLLGLTPADLERIKTKQLGVSFRQVDRAREDYRGEMGLLSQGVQDMLAGYVTRHRRIGGIR